MPPTGTRGGSAPRTHSRRRCSRCSRFVERREENVEERVSAASRSARIVLEYICPSFETKTHVEKTFRSRNLRADGSDVGARHGGTPGAHARAPRALRRRSAGRRDARAVPGGGEGLQAWRLGAGQRPVRPPGSLCAGGRSRAVRGMLSGRVGRGLGGWRRALAGDVRGVRQRVVLLRAVQGVRDGRRTRLGVRGSARVQEKAPRRGRRKRLRRVRRSVGVVPPVRQGLPRGC